MARVLARSSHLTGSEGSEYDLVVAETSEQPNLQQTEKIFGLHPQLMGIDTNELFTNEDLAPSMQAPSVPQTKTPIDETMCQPGGLSRREMNRARRKVCCYKQIIYWPLSICIHILDVSFKTDPC